MRGLVAVGIHVTIYKTPEGGHKMISLELC